MDDLLQQKLRETDATLFAELGAIVSPETYGDLGELERLGRAWFNRQRDRFARVICKEWNACAKLAEPRYSDRPFLLSAICDVLSDHFAGFPVATIAVLLVRVGLGQFCDCD